MLASMRRKGNSWALLKYKSHTIVQILQKTKIKNKTTYDLENSLLSCIQKNKASVWKTYPHSHVFFILLQVSHNTKKMEAT